MDTLPNEILKDIFSYFQFFVIGGFVSPEYGVERVYIMEGDPSRLSSMLHNISLVSKRFRAAIEPLLYHTLVVDQWVSWTLLLRTLCETPRYCRFIRELHFYLPYEIKLDQPLSMQRYFKG